jgi:DNA-binding transcriptional ArsR family regulator
MAEWAFLTNHARVLLHGIITDLAEAGYVITRKDGRRNRYQI